MAIKPLANEKEVLARIAKGDERAFTELFQWYYKPLGEFVFKLVDSLDITQEIIQDSFVKVWLRRETLIAIDNFSGYLFILCRNHAFSVMKKVAADKLSKQTIEQFITNELEESEYDNPADYFRELIENAVAKLPVKQKQVYKLSRYDRLKHDEIAHQLDLSPETVKKHIQLAVKFIHAEVNNHMNAGIAVVFTTAYLLKM